MGLIVDSFAGGGGASLGIAWALGRAPDIAINHDEAALTMHAKNHPSTHHVLEDVWKAKLRDLVGDQEVDLLWASPDCRHFARARGDAPVSKSVRSLAWIVVRWAVQVRPKVICLENVREFEGWGPIVPQFECRECEWRGTEGQAILCRVRHRCPRCNSLRLRQTEKHVPCPKRKGLTFRKWVGRLRGLGYEVGWQSLNAADFGAPTNRRRLFLVARRDGQPIIWPEPTHAAPGKCGKNLFGSTKPHRTAAECIDWSIPMKSIFAPRKKPLADATEYRIAHGLKRYVLDNPKPFLIRCAHGMDGRWGRGDESLDNPLPTATASNDFALVSPCLIPITHHGERRIPSVGEPLSTITTANGGEICVMAPVITRNFGGSVASSPDAPLPTTTAGGGGKSALVCAFIAKHFGGVIGCPIEQPLPTATTIATQNQIVAAHMVHLNHGDKQWSGCDEPLRTLTTANHAALVYAFLVRYFGTAIGQHLTDPLFTITGKDRFGLVTVAIDGDLWCIVDIGMRMLHPRELARAQGFPDTYILTGSKTSQVKRIGNSVSPYPAAALVRANCKQLAGV